MDAKRLHTFVCIEGLMGPGQRAIAIVALIDVVKWETNEREFCWKFPSNNLRIGTQLVVHTAQTAFFVKGGKVLDEFTAGTYTIKSANIPLLGKLINIPFGGDTPFQAEVWFINQISRLDMKWGTPQPIQLEDPKYGIIVPVRAFGQYGMSITNPRLFLESLIGNMSSFSAEVIDSYFKGKLISSLSSALSRKIVLDQIPISNISVYLSEISDFCQDEIGKTFEKYGLSLKEFSVMSVNIPEDDQSFKELKAAMATRAKMNVAGKDVYQMQRSFDVLERAAGNTSGIGGSLMGLGVGMGMGNIISGMAQQTINTSPSSQAVPPPVPQETTYYVYVNGQQQGGLTATQILQMKSQGIVNDETLVWAAGMPNWVTLKSVPALTSPSSAPPVPPVPPSI